MRRIVPRLGTPCKLTSGRSAANETYRIREFCRDNDGREGKRYVRMVYASRWTGCGSPPRTTDTSEWLDHIEYVQEEAVHDTQTRTRIGNRYVDYRYATSISDGAGDWAYHLTGEPVQITYSAANEAHEITGTQWYWYTNDDNRIAWPGRFTFS